MLHKNGCDNEKINMNIICSDCNQIKIFLPSEGKILKKDYSSDGKMQRRVKSSVKCTERCSVGDEAFAFEQRVQMWSLENWADCMMKVLLYSHLCFSIVLNIFLLSLLSTDCQMALWVTQETISKIIQFVKEQNFIFISLHVQLKITYSHTEHKIHFLLMIKDFI